MRTRISALVLLALLIYAAQLILDLLSADEPFDWAEFLLEDTPEWMLMAVVVAFAFHAAMRLKHLLAERSALTQALHQAAAERDAWRQSAKVHVDGLVQAIRQQFTGWRLTDSESGVAMLMLKGLSHKEIARLRNSSSATVRQQAAAVYAKSGLSSRAELAAYFLEDLFLPASGNGALPEPSDTCAMAVGQDAA